MTRRRFRALLRARGPTLDDWPPLERRAAMALLARSQHARHDLAAAFATDPSLDDGAVPVPRARMQAWLRRQVMAASLVQRPARGFALAGAFGWGAVAAGFALGAWLGAAEVPPSLPSDTLLTTSLATPLTPDL